MTETWVLCVQLSSGPHIETYGPSDLLEPQFNSIRDFLSAPDGTKPRSYTINGFDNTYARREELYVVHVEALTGASFQRVA